MANSTPESAVVLEKVRAAISKYDRPVILTIDGPDGCGKATVTQIISEALKTADIGVYHLEPPFYNTLTGKIITEYLKSTKASQIMDRKVISEMYGFDRNMYYAFNWDRMMGIRTPCVLLYNRSWLSNLIYQTTLIGATSSDPYKQTNQLLRIMKEDDNSKTLWEGTLSELRNHIVAEKMAANGGTPIIIKHDDVPKGMGIYSLGDDDDPSTCITADVFKTMEDIYLDTRINMILEMAEYIFANEIATWSCPQDMTKPFTDYLPVFNYVISPPFQKEGIEILMSNMTKRYNGDETKNDRNENRNFLNAVMENIMFLHAHQAQIFAPEMYMQYKHANSPISSPYLREEARSLWKAFNFNVVDTTKCVKNLYTHFEMNTATVQLPPDMVAMRILDNWISDMAR